MKGILGVFCFGTETRKKVLFVLGVSLSVCFECSPSYSFYLLCLESELRTEALGTGGCHRLGPDGVAGTPAELINNYLHQ